MAELSILVKMKDEASKQFDTLGKNLEKHSKTFRNVGIGMMAAGGAMVGGLVALGKTAADFDQNMREVNTMIGLTGEGFQKLKDDVQEVSSSVGKSTEDLSGALYQIVSAGVASADAIDVLTVASKAAVAGVTDVETAADGLTTILNAFKISASDAGHVADVMFTVVKRGKTNFEELSSAIFNVAPLAATAGIKFEEVAAAIATVTKQGVPTKIATTQLRAAIQAIIKPTTDMKTALDNMGFASGQALIQEQGLANGINMLREQAGGSLEELGKMFGSIEGLSAVLSITGENAATFAEDIKATTEDAAGAVEAAYAEMNEGVSRQFDTLMNDIKISGEKIGAALLPIFKRIIDSLIPIVEKVQAWAEANPALIETLLKIGGLLIVGGAIMMGLSMVAKAITAINIALAIFHGLSGPAGWIALAAGMALAGGAVYGISKMMGGIGAGAEAGLGGRIYAGGKWWDAEDYRKREAAGEALPPPSPPPSMQHGGIVTRPTFAMIGERGPEAVVPLNKGISPVNVYVNVEGSVRADRDLAETIRRELLKTKSRNFDLGFT